MIKHFIRSVIRLCRRLILGPRLAPLADLSQGEVVNLIEASSAGFGGISKSVGASGPALASISSKELDELKELCAQLVERMEVLERSNSRY